MDKKRNSEPSRLSRLVKWLWGGEYDLEKRMIWILIIPMVLIMGILLFVPVRTDITRATDAIDAYAICFDADNSHEVCLLQAIEAYN